MKPNDSCNCQSGFAVHDKSSDLVFELEIKHDKFAVFTYDVRFERKTEAQERETSVFLL